MIRIGYIDEDKGWRNTFRQFLKDEFDIILFDINKDSDIDTLTDSIFNANLDMLVIDFRLDETGLVDFNADSLIEKIQERNLYFPLIILTSHEVDALDHISNANIVNGKDMLNGDAHKREILVHKIRKISADYQEEYGRSITRLKELIDKRNKGEALLPNEEDEFVELSTYMDKTSNAKERSSRTFYSADTNKKLDEIIAIAAEILKNIPKSE